jgi:mono/diheme cytochrome c family protein
MLKRQFALIAILIGCVALMACGDADDEEVEEEVGLPSDIANYTSWTSVALGAPPAEATKPTESGGAHGKGTRTVYINPQGVETLKDASKESFPNGTTIVKAIMDDANTFLWRVAVMWKLDDASYSAHNGWKYVQYQQETADADLLAVAGDGTEKGSDGCHGCHSKVNDKAVSGKDSVFVQLLAAGLPADISGYTAWTSVALEGPPATFTKPEDSGVAHGKGTRTVYINSPGVEALKDAGKKTFSNGTTIVKGIMDDTNTFLWRHRVLKPSKMPARNVAVMWKLEDASYSAHNGWKYVQYQRESADADFSAAAGDGTAKGSNGCHGCHAKVNDDAVEGKDSVFVQLP